MNISEMIAALEALKDKHGDLPVWKYSVQLDEFREVGRPGFAKEYKDDQYVHPDCIMMF